MQVQGFAPNDEPYDPTNPLSFTYERFKVLVGGTEVHSETNSDPNGYKPYASGVRQTYSIVPGFGGKQIFEYYPLAMRMALQA